MWEIAHRQMERERERELARNGLAKLICRSRALGEFIARNGPTNGPTGAVAVCASLLISLLGPVTEREFVEFSLHMSGGEEAERWIGKVPKGIGRRIGPFLP